MVRSSVLEQKFIKTWNTTWGGYILHSLTRTRKKVVEAKNAKKGKATDPKKSSSHRFLDSRETKEAREVMRSMEKDMAPTATAKAAAKAIAKGAEAVAAAMATDPLRGVVVAMVVVATGKPAGDRREVTLPKRFGKLKALSVPIQTMLGLKV
ncbi:hypothetical protein AK812_SmicGene25573 [Symbiodinium microadriaticum]|uniref:Uncharacterized protein n=1 Tax=Symbiodinium microadriaticum TaxID=2951 RepID=A0A1Q9DBP5_SYMMI|nr:hypothetical protein AK812_SmicGene25573 [Symbiodinium microadriaticum]